MAVISDRKQEPTYSTPAAPGEEDPLLPPRGPPPAYDGPSSSSSSVPTAAGPSSTSNPRAQQQQQRRAPLRTRKSIFSLFSTRDHPITSEDEEHEEEQDEQEINPNTYQGRHIIRTRRQADLAQRRHTRRVRRAAGCCRRCCVLLCWVVLGAGVIAGLGALVLFILQQKSDEGGERVNLRSARLLAQG